MFCLRAVVTAVRGDVSASPQRRLICRSMTVLVDSPLDRFRASAADVASANIDLSGADVRILGDGQRRDADRTDQQP